MLNIANYQKAPAKTNRLLFLDGLRGVAIMLVLLYHAFSDWQDYLPYGDHYDYIPIFHYGNLGVQLFFMISGFVISMTLDKCKTMAEFMYRRWLRLFPAMLIASVLTFATASFFIARPYGQPELLDFLPGLVFIEPEFFRSVFGYDQRIAEGVVWTLFVEMKFYIVAGLLYFAWGRKTMITVLIAMFLSSIVFEFLAPHLNLAAAERLNTIFHYLNYRHYGWFAAGALFYQFYVSKNSHDWLAATFVALLSARCLAGVMSGTMIAASLMIIIFALTTKIPELQNMLSSKVLLFLGFISYPLYLVHEQDMVSMILQLDAENLPIPEYMLPVLPMLVTIIFAWLIAEYAEPAVRNTIKNYVNSSKLRRPNSKQKSLI